MNKQAKQKNMIWAAIVLLMMVFCPSGNLFAQKEYKETRRGNKEYKEGNFTEANKHFEQAISENPGFPKAHNNLGSSMYKQENYEGATKHFEKATLNATEKEELANYYYNLGNSYLKANKLDKSIEAFKQSLRLNPADKQAKHNLSLVNKRKQQQQNQQQNQQQDQQNQEQNQEQQQNQQDQQNQQQQEQQQQQQQGQQNEQEQEQQQQQPMNQMQKDDAERLLNLMEQNEKELLKKLDEEKSKQQRRDADKNW